MKKISTTVEQYTTVYHIEHGKGQVVSLTPKMKDYLVMCYFPSVKSHEWVLLSALQTDTDEYISLTKREVDKLMNKDADPLQSALNNLFGGGR
tara:strand:+ start:391 stop:669 length:279 start_codon:yes stop_codon:yes gene_type:complete